MSYIDETGLAEVTTKLKTYIDSKAGGGGVSTQSQSIFTGYTAPLTWLNSTNNVFTYESATHNITITGLDSIATISGNGTKSVTVTIDTTASADRQTAFTITCTNGDQTLTYNGIAFHYGSDLASGNCLVVAQTIANSQISYIFIESASLPSFSSNTSTWNSVHSQQIITFDFGKFNSTSTVENFLKFCYVFNQPLTIPNTITSIANYFLSYCKSFNQPLTIPNTVTRIGSYFLASTAFNQPLTIPNSVGSIGTYFLYQCYAFNQPLTISNTLNYIGTYFLNQCYAFNQPLTIPNSVGSIGQRFLYQCYAFNQPLTIPSSVTSIAGNFLYDCQSFNQPLIIPSTVTSIGSYFLANCYSLIHLEYNASVYPSDDNSLSQNIDSKTSSSGTGILLTGTHASDLKTALPDRTTSMYRKLVLAGV